MEKERIAPATPEDDKNLAKVVQPDQEMEIPVGNGIRKKVFWKRLGFGQRSLFKGYFDKKFKDAKDSGVIGIAGHFKGVPQRLETSDKNEKPNENYFVLAPVTLDPTTLRVYNGSTLMSDVKDYTYSHDMRVLFLKHNFKPTVEYDFYDEDFYNQMYQDCFITLLVYLSCFEIDNHSKRVFSHVEDVEGLSIEEENEILNKYSEMSPFGAVQPDGEKLKNLPASLPSLGGDATQNVAVSIPGEPQSGAK